MKAEWPEADKAARRIAGHANASRGASILWLIGVDESRGVVGVGANELATWFPKLEAQFDGLAPEHMDLTVPANGHTVVALYFETERAPFVVKNPAHGQKGGGPVANEVPWRDSTAVRSARRSELLRLLSPLAASPEIEVLSADLEALPEHGSGGQRHTFELALGLYLTAQPGVRTIVPYHRYNLSMREAGKVSGEVVLGETPFEPKAVKSPQNTAGPPASGIRNNLLLRMDGELTEELRMEGSGEVAMSAVCTVNIPDTSAIDEIAIKAELRPVNTEVPVFVEVAATKVDRGPMFAGALWTYRSEV